MNIAGLLPATVNSVAVLIGSSVGTLLKKGISDKYKRILFFAVGLSTFGIGIKMILEVNNFLIVLFSMAFGGLLGEFFDIEGKLKIIGDKMKEGDFSTGFVTASLLFLVGPMTIVGSITAGLKGDGSIIYTKSLLDFISSIVLSSTYGIGVMVSAFSVLVVQGAITLFAGSLKFLSEPVYLNDLVAVGGLMVLGIGFRILEVKDTWVGNFLPALIFSPFLTFITLLLK
ncbi:DUF554 domain-containing protein [Fervidobacterium gondwanense]|uniref:DUF554 domain-containing protein n=1 Tax=Fervidobacterium gondwanense TaxID=44754 RepID=UPI003C796D9E